MKAFRELTDQEWGKVEPLLPECRPQSNRDPRGRPMKNRRACMNATLFVMFTGVSWQMLPRKYPSYQTCHRCFKAWYDAGVMHKVSTVLFSQDAASFLALVAARVRIALRETRGGVGRALKTNAVSGVASSAAGVKTRGRKAAATSAPKARKTTKAAPVAVAPAKPVKAVGRTAKVAKPTVKSVAKPAVARKAKSKAAVPQAAAAKRGSAAHDRGARSASGRPALGVVHAIGGRQAKAEGKVTARADGGARRTSKAVAA